MAATTISSYLNWITPTPGDPTHSILRAHLLFERLLDAFLEKALPHPATLSDARFTFAQKLAISRSAAAGIAPSHWTRQAVTRLNKIRNALAHAPGPKLTNDLKEYVDYCLKHSGSPLPPSGQTEVVPNKSAGDLKSAYTAADLVTVALYIALASRLGFDVNAFAEPRGAA